MRSTHQKTREALHAHTVAIVGLTAVGVALTVIFWLGGVFEGANPAGGWVSNAVIAVTLSGLALSCACLVITDFTHHLLPHVLLVPTAVGVLLGMFVAWLAGADAGAALRGLALGVAAGIVLFAVALLPGTGLGGGDVKLAALLATVLGWLHPPALLIALVCALLSATIFAVSLIGARKATLASAIPLGPFLILGAWGALAVSLFF